MDRPEKSRALSQHLSPKSASKPRNFSNNPLSQSLKASENFDLLPYRSKSKTKSFKQNLKKDSNQEKPVKKELELESIEEGKGLKAYYRSRYTSLIKSIQDSNKQKMIQKELEELKLKKMKEKLKDELGLSQVKSKFKQISEDSSEKQEKIEKNEKNFVLKRNSAVETEEAKLSPEELKIKRENALKIVKRAQEHLQKIADKKVEEQKKEEEAVAREQKLRQALKEAILNRNPEEGEIQRKKSEKLLTHPKKIIITDMALYKKRNKLTENDKVFIIYGCYPDIRKALLAKGNWHENLDVTSPCFDLKWTVRRKDIDFDSLQSHQLCNHFNKSTMITTKDGLCHSLRNLIWFNSVDIDTFYPRCFDLSDSAEREDFFTEFKVVRAETILKQASSGDSISSKVLKTALKVTKKRLRDLDELIDDPKASTWELVSEKDWKILSGPVQGPLDGSLLGQVRDLLEKLREKYPQFDLNGKDNIWILKPAGLSRGRGIEIYNHIEEIRDKVQKEGQFVIQKYIENPLIVKGKKFDIRQWVLVTSWNPLTAWFYDHCYLRFGVEDYSNFDLKNKFVHLTNNSIQKNSEKFDNTEIEGNMWHSEDFRSYLRSVEGFDIWGEKIKPEIKKIVTYSLECVQDMVDGRQGSCELYGYDVMIDENYKPWLIEVNCSPAMDYSTQVTEFMVKDVMNDTIKIMVDHFYASQRDKAFVDTGDFTLLVKSEKTVDLPVGRFGLSLLCQGKAIK
jgi:tubulin monoglycylase TTLL3/8